MAHMMRRVLIGSIVMAIMIGGCIKEESGNQTKKQPPAEKPKGVLIREIPRTSDIIFSSIRHVLEDLNCLDENYEIKNNFILDADCNKKIYGPGGGLASSRQLYAMDMETGNVVQITNMDYDFTSGQVIGPSTMMASVACSDTDNDGRITDKDQKELYMLDLTTGEMDCLTCGLGLEAINNPDYSHVNGAIVFSAREGSGIENPHHIYTIDAQKNLRQITEDREYYDFDCSWSEDGRKIVFNRLPAPPFTAPSQIWLMDANGSNMERITEGGDNPDNEEPQGVFPIGLDADPHLSPDNNRIVFSRLKTGKENEPFGIYELIVVDVDSKEENVLDSSYANMLPEWKSGGILFIRQVGTAKPMDIQQGAIVDKF